MHFPTCSIDGCERRSHCRGWCTVHYDRWRRTGSTDGIRPHGTIEERFWRYVDRDGPNGCWRWTGFLNWAGYGRLGTGGAKGMRTASRVSYELHKGAIPKGMVVRHKCDNAACVNPDHLELGTQRDNVRDMIARGRGNWRAPQGEERHNAILTEDRVREILASNERGVDLAERYGVKQATISAIRHRRIWKHVT